MKLKNSYLVCQEFILMLLFAPFVRKLNSEGTFLISPGGGRDYTYSPVGVNATLECKVRNNDLLTWEVDNLRFGSESTILNERGVFQSEQTASSEGLSSVLLVHGNMTENNGSKICCLTLVRKSIADICTTLIIYGK